MFGDGAFPNDWKKAVLSNLATFVCGKILKKIVTFFIKNDTILLNQSGF